ncbi:hypothetical protein NQ315_004008 [Exocentrus adspersus]|uniref:Regulatory protein zeste n=1 Tax=Exocentrus adspersus TaxID=1586481 RepID=A0AAV8V751_9CUCU|nr:hypothetical protein NQ315_004008 [Exocentrus adspersus]
MDKKARCQNFTKDEIDVLVDLVQEFKHVVECKKTDTVTSSAKDAEWRNIEIKFNAACATGRSAKMLRNKWDSLKKTAKKEYAKYKQNFYRTGGGPAVDMKIISEIIKKILDIIGVGATGTHCKFDCDYGTIAILTSLVDKNSIVKVSTLCLHKTNKMELKHCLQYLSKKRKY